MRPCSLPSRALVLLAAGLALSAPSCVEGDPVVEGTVILPPRPSGPGQVVWISDVHFDPFYPSPTPAGTDSLIAALVDSSATSLAWRPHAEWPAVLDRFPWQGAALGARGEDANAGTVRAVLRQAAATLPDPAFVLLTGDLLAHEFAARYAAYAPAALQTPEGYDAFVAETFAFVAASVREAFPGTAPVVATLGNNDAYCGDYDVLLDTPASDFFQDTADVVLAYFLPGLSPEAQSAFRAEYLDGGSYAADVGGGERVLVLNSVVLTGSYPERGQARQPFQHACAAKAPVSADSTLTWLEAAAASPTAAWVAMHVPPGTACYDASPDWTADAERRVAALFAGRPAALAAGFAGHSHMASFKLIGDGVVYQAPSIGPNHGNNPAFSVLTYAPETMAVTGLEVHYLDLDSGGWGRYAFAGDVGPPTAAALAALRDSFATAPAAFDTFAVRYGAHGPVELGDLSATETACLAAGP